jgi:putative transposase
MPQACKYGISSATIYKLKAKYGGVRRLKTLEDENTKMKKLLAEAMLDNAMLKDVASGRIRDQNQAFARCSHDR